MGDDLAFASTKTAIAVGFHIGAFGLEPGLVLGAVPGAMVPLSGGLGVAVEI